VDFGAGNLVTQMATAILNDSTAIGKGWWPHRMDITLFVCNLLEENDVYPRRPRPSPLPHDRSAPRELSRR
jgi:hypothetical protein